ncbi:lipid droplet-associated hydrolase [Macadamia integrifolia]|uniref:lipid droplet-associated hydrolase n=1 Tax=Macadamia integrifolia TaxID=60698 RepID=UPI001C4F1F8B|nr:lipid droplet-associated hydrolase [Macadamia integrifolia]XP_042515880.1 lipid droplet-associated hydrolase [Macadamia integrifolia]
MLLRIPSFVSCYLSFPLSICSFRPRNMCTTKIKDDGVGQQISHERKQATYRICSVSSHMTELLELRAEDPSFHVLFIPGNPGVVSYYKEFVEALYELLGETSSVTAIGHISHTRKNWEHGCLFSLQDQIDHKMDFIKQEIRHTEIPLLLVGHSIGSYISVEIFKRVPEQVKYCIGLYPFLTLDKKSFKQSVIGKISASQALCVTLSSIVAVLGFLPSRVTRALVRRYLGSSWSSTAVEATCTHLLQYHCVRNVLFMAMTEFIKLSEVPDWMFIRGRQDKIAFLFGIDDHWGPLTMFEEISKQAPDVALSIEREGHTHAFCSTGAGSIWVAQHVASLIKYQCQDKSGSSQEMLEDLNA